MKKLLIILLLFLSVGFCIYLLKRKVPIAEKMTALYGMKVELPIEQMAMVHSQKSNGTLNKDAIYKMIVFYDSLSCSSCAYKHMFIWDDFIAECKKVQNRTLFYFVLNPSKENQNNLFQALQIDYGFSEPLFVDTTGVFMKENPNLPSEKLFHCMLLDRANKVILVGDPTSNQRLNNLYIKAISNQ